MDRFIGKEVQDRQKPQANLKSNMDRFIGTHWTIKNNVTIKFKIQYG